MNNYHKLYNGISKLTNRNNIIIPVKQHYIPFKNRLCINY